MSVCALPNGAIGLTCDSRTVRVGDLFAAFEGTQHQGVDFVHKAFAKGACAFLVPLGKEKPDSLPHEIPWIEHPNPRKQFAELASCLYAKRPEVLVAATGTNGKSSSVAFLQQMWNAQGRKSAAIGTLGVTKAGANTEQSRSISDYALTTPDAVRLHRELEALHEQQITHVAMEASSHGLAQYRLDGIRFEAALLTNFSQDHLDYHKTMRHYRAAKIRLFTDLLEGDAVVCLPLFEPLSAGIERLLPDTCHLVKTHSDEHDNAQALVSAYALSPFGEGAQVQLRIGERRQTLTLPFQERFQVQNWLGAVAISHALAEDSEQHWQGLANWSRALTTPQGRMERFALPDIDAQVFVDFAHTPHALETVLHAARARAKGRTLCVFGCGGERDRAKRPRMGRIAFRLADRVIVTDDNPRSEDPAVIRRAICAACPSASEIGDRRAAIETAIAELGSGDVLVVAGKGHEREQITARATIPFDDREVVGAAISRRA